MQKEAILNRIRELSHPIDPEALEHETQLQPLSGIKCVALDFYGTMFISGVGDIGLDEEQQEGNVRLFEEALVHSGFSTTKDGVGEIGLEKFQTLIEHHINRKRKQGIDYPEPNIIDISEELLTELVENNQIEGRVDREKAIEFDIEFEFRVNAIWPLPDLASILKDLLDRDLKLGIISNSQFYTPLTFESLIGTSTNDFGFEPELQLWSYKAGIKKPSTRFYRIFTDRLTDFKLSPEQILYAGNDLFKDVIPAKKLGMKTALYVGDRRSIRHEEKDFLPAEQQPDLIIDNLSQILECLG